MRGLVLLGLVAAAAGQGALCETSITLSTARVAAAASKVLKATETCNMGLGANCTAAVSAASAAVAAAEKSGNSTAKECGSTGTCGSAVATAHGALAKVAPLMAKAVEDCTKTELVCNAALVRTETQLARAAVGFHQASKDCNSTVELRTPVCEAEVILGVTRVGEAVRAVAAAGHACNNGTATECLQGVAAASSKVKAAGADIKRATGECGDPTARCGRHVAVAATSVETAVELMDHAATTCGRTGIDRVHCRIDLLLVETELARSDLFLAEAATMCAGKNRRREEVAGAICEAEVAVVLTRILDAGRDLSAANHACSNGTSADCKAAVAKASGTVRTADVDSKRAERECGDATARCGRHVKIAVESLETAVALMDNATTTCGRTGIDRVHCRIDLLMVDTEVARAAAFAVEAEAMCAGKKQEAAAVALGTAVCEAEVVLVLTRIGDAGGALRAANHACNNGTAADCMQGVTTSSAAVGRANEDSKRAAKECGDPTARCGRHVAVSDKALETAVELMDHAKTTCGRTGIDRVHCRIDLLMVDTEVARAAVFSAEAATMCAGRAAL